MRSFVRGMMVILTTHIIKTMKINNDDDDDCDVEDYYDDDE